MVHPSTNNVQTLQKEIAELKEKISKLERQITLIQKNCSHSFFETPFMRKCVKCHYVEILYY
jgi:FtsZ-binding cell division protein ZapB